MVKCSGLGCRGKSGPISQSMRPRGFPETISALSASSPFILRSSIPEDRKIEAVHIHKRIYVFCLYPEKALRSLRTLRLIFSSSSEDAETFIFSQEEIYLYPVDSPRYAWRTVSFWRRLSALSLRRIVPVCRTYPRSATWRAMRAFCSTRRMVVPAS
jgi:hypothetical protein